eukprot:TRINITY_DN29136_c0_g1_i1.p1 TRINITY_DN29136_c0_g1~~TRINITY_DN29136_c0_g1_i1.p1  ORF type:complete len:546 (-),score=134.55 TRINITY_DN29136_c0_g1_i1:114-1751(-)
MDLLPDIFSPGGFSRGYQEDDLDRTPPDGAKEARKRAARAQLRAATSFPEASTTEAVGPWRTTEVECRDAATSSSWLLVGRRHSVDERRDSIDQTKVQFLRKLAARTDGIRRSTTTACCEALQHMEERIEAQISEQTSALERTGKFWADRHAADLAYLAKLQSSQISSSDASSAAGATPLPKNQADREQLWLEETRKAAERSWAWAKELPVLIDSHRAAASQVRRATRLALQDVEAASKAVRQAQSALRPSNTAVQAAKMPGTHSEDGGPEGSCLWLVACRRIAAEEDLQRAQRAALARLKREEKRLACVRDWVDAVLDRESGSGSSLDEPPVPSLPELVPEQSPEQAPEDDGTSSRDEESDLDDTPRSASDTEALIICRHDVELCSGDDASWTPAHILLSVDLWLHIWTPPQLAKAAPASPSRSIPLARACRRPVATRSREDVNVLVFSIIPGHEVLSNSLGQAATAARPTALGLLSAFGLLNRWSAQAVKASGPDTCKLCIRVGGGTDKAAQAEDDSDSEADALLTSLELVEKLYPLPEAVAK